MAGGKNVKRGFWECRRPDDVGDREGPGDVAEGLRQVTTWLMGPLGKKRASDG